MPTQPNNQPNNQPTINKHNYLGVMGVIEVGVVLSWWCLRSVIIAVVGVDVVGLRALCECVGVMFCTRCEDNEVHPHSCCETIPQIFTELLLRRPSVLDAGSRLAVIQCLLVNVAVDAVVSAGLVQKSPAGCNQKLPAHDSRKAHRM